METLNYRQLAAKFPICPNNESSEQAWSLLLKKWRDNGKLEQRRHWRYGPSTDGNNQPTRFYELAKVVRLVCLEARGKVVRPRISLLYTEYYDEFATILSEANAANAAIKEQATA